MIHLLILMKMLLLFTRPFHHMQRLIDNQPLHFENEYTKSQLRESLHHKMA